MACTCRMPVVGQVREPCKSHHGATCRSHLLSLRVQMSLSNCCSCEALSYWKPPWMGGSTQCSWLASPNGSPFHRPPRAVCLAVTGIYASELAPCWPHMWQLCGGSACCSAEIIHCGEYFFLVYYVLYVLLFIMYLLCILYCRTLVWGRTGR